MPSTLAPPRSLQDEVFSSDVLDQTSFPKRASSKHEEAQEIETKLEAASDLAPPPPPPPPTITAARWNQPRSNIPKVFAAFWTFIVMGCNDAVYGVSLWICRHGNVTTTYLSYIMPCHTIPYHVI